MLRLILIFTLFATALTAYAANTRIVIKTSEGDILVELFDDKAPRSVENILDLVDNDFYDGLIFHRVIANFVVQGGGYDEKLIYRTPPRSVVNESANGLKNTRGTLALARAEDPDSADSQFFFNVNDNEHLDRSPSNAGYTVFGRVLTGMKVVSMIELSDTHVAQGMAGVPERAITILSVERY
ncbi:MAG: peptidylprolyl isomerase [Proteobacteria bacterium]|nr:peptidylprolyl isomerase [Pseudomonadota bacterium]